MATDAFPEFSSIREYLYLEEPVPYDRTLESLLARVTGLYTQRTSHGTKVFTFSTRTADDALQFVVSGAPAPAVGGIAIRHQTDDLSAVLAQIDSPIQALFEGAEYEPATLSRLKTTTRGGLLTSVFLPHDRRFSSVLEHATALGERVVRTLHQADALRAHCECYADDDPRNTLVHVDCDITRQAGMYTFEYRVRTATLDPVPECFLAYCRGLFTLVEPSFERLMVYRPRIQPFRAGHE